MSATEASEANTQSCPETESRSININPAKSMTNNKEDIPSESETQTEDRNISSQPPQTQISSNAEQTTNLVKDEKRLMPSNNDSQTRANSSLNYNSQPQLQPHVATAQNIFSGKSGAGMMCSNLRSNPFSIGSDQGSNSSTTILAKPKFNLKPSQFGSAKGDSSSVPVVTSTSSSSAPSAGVANPYIRPAKLNYDSDDAENSNADSSTTTKPVVASGDKTDAETKKDNFIANQTAQNGLASFDETPSTSRTIARANTDTFGSFGQNLTTFSDTSSASFVFGEKLDDRVTNVTRENGATNGHMSEADKPRVQTVEEAVVEYKKQQVGID